jgi:dTDP-4-dehydrorhamnose reductase
MRVLLTGRDGQVARSLLEKAESLPDMELIPAGRPEVDLADPGSVARVIRAVSPDLVINAAAYTAVDQAEDEPELAFRINAEAAGEAAAAARAVNAAILQLSTDYVFDGQARVPY